MAMKTKTILQVSMLLSGFLSACSSAPESTDGEAAGTQQEALASCSSNIAIWERPPTVPSCPAGSPGWTVAQLFPGTSAPALKRYCEYTWTGAGAPNYQALN